MKKPELAAQQEPLHGLILPEYFIGATARTVLSAFGQPGFCPLLIRRLFWIVSISILPPIKTCAIE